MRFLPAPVFAALVVAAVLPGAAEPVDGAAAQGKLLVCATQGKNHRPCRSITLPIDAPLGLDAPLKSITIQLRLEPAGGAKSVRVDLSPLGRITTQRAVVRLVMPRVGALKPDQVHVSGLDRFDGVRALALSRVTLARPVELASMSALAELRLEDAGALTQLPAMPTVTTLSLTRVSREIMDSIPGFATLKSLHVANERPNLKRLPKTLRSLTLAYSAITDIGPLARLGELQQLQLTGNPIVDLRPLAGLTELRELGLGGVKATDFRPLTKLRRLTRLDLSGTALRSARPLRKMSALQELALSASKITDLRGLERNKKLSEVYLDGTRPRTLKPVMHMRRGHLLLIGTPWDGCLHRKSKACKRLNRWAERRDVWVQYEYETGD